MNYEYWKSKNDHQWYWHLIAANGEKIAQGEAYTTKSACIAAVKLVKNSSVAPEHEISAGTRMPAARLQNGGW
jgi:uncharacterized protein YegP (UPF0339 family)